ncbi:phage distal tail protein [Streptomyces sp.]|uniref:phage distal tail protein n=1 Tax=Streptomyces sp. TaxID=1931 RepID=UPI002F91F142
MARAGRSYPNRPNIARHPRNWDWHIALGPFETLAEWPAITAETPNADVLLAPLETLSEWPGLDIAVDFAATLPAFETLSEWPDPGVVVPVLPGDDITGNYQIEFNGTVFGGYGNQYQIIAGSVEGWDDLPALDSANVPRPSGHGAWPGRYLAQARQVTATIAVNIGDGGDFAGAVAEIRKLLTPPAGETGAPLVISTRDEILLSLEAVADSRAMPTGAYHAGWIPVAVRWICADPRRYNVIRSGINIPVASTQTIENAGNVETHPLLRLDGPVENPVVANTTLGRTIAFAVTLNSTQRLTIDTDAGNATIDGESALSTLTGTSAPVSDFVFERGTNQISYTASSGGSKGLVTLYRDAWL